MFKQFLISSCSTATKFFFFVSDLTDLLSTGEDQSQVDQPNNLAQGHPMLSNHQCRIVRFNEGQEGA